MANEIKFKYDEFTIKIRQVVGPFLNRGDHNFEIICTEMIRDLEGNDLSTNPFSIQVARRFSYSGNVSKEYIIMNLRRWVPNLVEESRKAKFEKFGETFIDSYEENNQ